MASNAKRVPRIPTRNREAGSPDLLDWDCDCERSDMCFVHRLHKHEECAVLAVASVSDYPTSPSGVLGRQ